MESSPRNVPSENCPLAEASALPPMLLPVYVRKRSRSLEIQLTWDKENCDPLPERQKFSEGTCEC